MAKVKECKCRFSHCSHPDDLLPPEQMIQDKRLYYHKECLQLKKDLAKIRELYIELEPNVVMAFLNKMINMAVFEKNISASDIIFALEYYKKNNKQIKSPAQLLYIPYNREIRNAKRQKRDNIKIDFTGKCESLGTDSSSFTYKPQEKKGFANVIKGKR